MLLFNSQISFSQCSDPYEPNDSKTTAALIPTNEEIHALIGTTLDVDYFKVLISEPSNNLRVILFNLPKDYNLFVYNKANQKIGTSKNKFQVPDTVTLNGLSIGTYWIKVRGKAGAYDPSHCYSMIALTSSDPFRLSTLNSAVTNENFSIDLYPNPTATSLFIDCDDEGISDATFSVFSLTGQRLSTTAQANDNATTIINVENLPAGQYFLEVRYAQGREIKKFVVSR